MSGNGARIQDARTVTIPHVRRHRSGLLQLPPIRQGSLRLQTPGPRSEPAPPRINFRVGIAPSTFRHLVGSAYGFCTTYIKLAEIRNLSQISSAPSLPTVVSTQLECLADPQRPHAQGAGRNAEQLG